MSMPPAALQIDVTDIRIGQYADYFPAGGFEEAVIAGARTAAGAAMQVAQAEAQNAARAQRDILWWSLSHGDRPLGALADPAEHQLELNGLNNLVLEMLRPHGLSEIEVDEERQLRIRLDYAETFFDDRV
jgi:hypothetical protein